VKLDNKKDGYQVKTHTDAIFYRSAIRSLEKASTARKQEKDPQKEHDALIDEVEYSAMCIIASVTCLESYINFVIDKYVTPEMKSIFEESMNLRQRWLLVPLVLQLPFRFNGAEDPFKAFSELVSRRNRAIHYQAVFRNTYIHKTSEYKGSGSHTYSEFNLENSKKAIRIIRQMVSKLSEDGKVPVPAWLDGWREARYILKDLL
jgi:hypothetical protein